VLVAQKPAVAKRVEKLAENVPVDSVTSSVESLSTPGVNISKRLLIALISPPYKIYSLRSPYS